MLQVANLYQATQAYAKANQTTASLEATLTPDFCIQALRAKPSNPLRAGKY